MCTCGIDIATQQAIPAMQIITCAVVGVRPKGMRVSTASPCQCTTVQFVEQHRSFGQHGGRLRLTRKKTAATEELGSDKAFLHHLRPFAIAQCTLGHPLADDEQRMAPLAGLHDGRAGRKVTLNNHVADAMADIVG